MRDLNGIELCERLSVNRPDVPVVVITAFGSLETAVAAIRAGAYDFITKPFDTEQLVLTLERAIQHRALREEVQRLRQAVAETQHVADMVGESEPMRRLHEVIRRTAAADAPVLITGESGTGKELVARALHQLSERRAHPFIAVNCAAMPETLLESELFGHVKGAFTDARSDRKGLFIEAGGGTLLLDEIGTMPASLQPKLLRVLQDKRVRPVGGNREVEFDVRVIASTNADLETAVEEGRFRSDLYYRLNVIQIAVPPLRSRGADILLLAQHFIQQRAARMENDVVGLSSGAGQKRIAYTWPGNIRELQNCIESAVALTDFEKLTVEDLPERIRGYTPSYVLLSSDNPNDLRPMAEVEKRYIYKVMEAMQGNKTLAARILGLDRKTLYRKLEQYERGE
jgi:two-component system response regulator HydG